MYNDCVWWVDFGHALHVDESGLCLVQISRLIEREDICQVYEEFDSAYYGPAEPLKEGMPF
jgi:hypothetical protein|tara:strand:+ start:1232 stop:1414 length:183 start_codon:yes stop_codon:yes gene_type:complete